MATKWAMNNEIQLVSPAIQTLNMPTENEEWTKQ